MSSFAAAGRCREGSEEKQGEQLGNSWQHSTREVAWPGGEQWYWRWRAVDGFEMFGERINKT